MKELKKQFVVVEMQQPTVYATEEEAKQAVIRTGNYSKVDYVWDDASVVELARMAQDRTTTPEPLRQGAVSELIEMARLFESHHSMPYSEASRVELAKYHKATKWWFIKKSSLAYTNMQRSIYWAKDKAKREAKK